MPDLVADDRREFVLRLQEGEQAPTDENVAVAGRKSVDLVVVEDVEVVFLYPWATKFLTLELFALIEMAVFVGILLLAWAYAWRKRDLEWQG